ncbi:MAG: hypothetical protein WA705_24055 [Candidatus Ozemobacteraceae bacterium]
MKKNFLTVLCFFVCLTTSMVFAGPKAKTPEKNIPKVEDASSTVETPVATATEDPGETEGTTASKPADVKGCFEHWKGHGVRFVIRRDGKLVSWGVGTLESWGDVSTWVVRDLKGQFLTRVTGQFETWKNGKVWLVFREKNGKMIGRVDSALAGKGTFEESIIALKRLSVNSKSLGFAQDLLENTLIQELKASNTVHVKTLFDDLEKNIDKASVVNFRPIINKLSQQLSFMATQEQTSNPDIGELAKRSKELYKEIGKQAKKANKKPEKKPDSESASQTPSVKEPASGTPEISTATPAEGSPENASDSVGTDTDASETETLPPEEAPITAQ